MARPDEKGSVVHSSFSGCPWLVYTCAEHISLSESCENTFRNFIETSRKFQKTFLEVTSVTYTPKKLDNTN